MVTVTGVSGGMFAVAMPVVVVVAALASLALVS